MTRNWTIFSAIVAVSLWLAWAFQVPLIRSTRLFWRPETLGQWGDTFGALNALFAAGAFIGVLWTLRQQRLETQRQQKQIKDAEISQGKQQFDATFFLLLRLLRELREQIQFHHTQGFLNAPDTVRISGIKNGTEALELMNREIEYALNRKLGDAKYSQQEIALIYENNIRPTGDTSLSPYFRIVYTILRRVSENPYLSTREKADYGNLLRAQITTPELFIAGVNGLHAVSANFKKYLIEFRMFKYVPNGKIRDALRQHYPDEAFLGRDEP